MMLCSKQENLSALLIHLISLLMVVEELDHPIHCCKEARPGVRASHREQGALADLKRVLEVLEQLWDIFFHLAKGLHVWVYLTQQKLYNAEDVFAHRAGKCLGRHWMLIAVSAEILY